MATARSIRKLIRSRATLEGAGVHLKRAFGNAEAPAMDPFLLLDDFRLADPRHYIKGFPWHPHRGIETITYVLRGHVEHGDSLGHQDVIGAGDVQWMTAGSGIVHQEMPKGDRYGHVEGFQLWANLPAAHKMIEPRYRAVRQADIPVVVTSENVRIRVICGEARGTRGPIGDVVTAPTYLDVTVPPGTVFSHPTPPGHTVLAYIIEGRADFCRASEPFSYDVEGVNYFELERSPSLANETLVLFGDGEEIVVATDADPVRFLLLAGQPLREPIAWYGPIVMNTREQLQTAFQDYKNGTFVKHGSA